jgi:hypothetical protein
MGHHICQENVYNTAKSWKNLLQLETRAFVTMETNREIPQGADNLMKGQRFGE